MSVGRIDLRAGSATMILVGDCGSPLARSLRELGHRVTELLPSDFRGQEPRMVDVVAVLPDCGDVDRVGAVAAACANLVWFQERVAPPEVSHLLAAAGVPVIEGRDLLSECRP